MQAPTLTVFREDLLPLADAGSNIIFASAAADALIAVEMRSPLDKAIIDAKPMQQRLRARRAWHSTSPTPSTSRHKAQDDCRRERRPPHRSRCGDDRYHSGRERRQPRDAHDHRRAARCCASARTSRPPFFPLAVARRCASACRAPYPPPLIAVAPQIAVIYRRCRCATSSSASASLMLSALFRRRCSPPRASARRSAPAVRRCASARALRPVFPRSPSSSP